MRRSDSPLTNPKKHQIFQDIITLCLSLINVFFVFLSYTAQCLALVSHMTDNQKTIFLRKVLSSEEIMHLKMKYV